MNGKRFVGENASSFETYKPKTPVTGVRLVVDDENEYVAGDMSGNVWEMTCPYATQEMANNILDGLKGQVYKGFEADDAVLDPSAELGDGITVNGLYSVLAYRKVQFGPGHMSTIAAPGDNEPDEEYKYTPKRDRETDRKFAQTRSLITKSAEEIRLAIEATDGRVSELKVTLDGVTITDESGTTRIKGSSIETGSIAAGAIKADQIQLTGAITWGDLNSNVQNRFGDGLTESDVHTLIEDDLVASPTIAGGKFSDLSQRNYLKMSAYSSSNRYRTANLQHFYTGYSTSTPVEEMGYMYTEDFNGRLTDTWSFLLFGNDILTYFRNNNYFTVYGTWDFSYADVTGMDIHMTFTA